MASDGYRIDEKALEMLCKWPIQLSMQSSTSTRSTRSDCPRALGLVVILACSCTREAPPVHAPVVAETPRSADILETSGATLAPARFERAQDDLGLDFMHVGNAEDQASARESIGAGIVLFDANNDARLDLYITNGARSGAQGATQGPMGRFYSMEGERFVDRTVDAGLAVPSLTGRALGARAIDFDGDGDWDLCVSFVSQDRLMRNEGGRFTEVTAEAAIAGGMVEDVDEAAKGGPEDETASPGGEPSLTSSPTFARALLDANLDGHVDLLTLDGALEPDHESTGASTGPRQVPRLFLGTGATAKYTDASASSGPVFDAPIAGRGLALGDLDGDSDIDVVVIEEGGPAQVWLNQNPSGNRPLRLVLLSKAPNTYALGAEVELAAGPLGQPQRVRMGRRYLSQHEHALTFGLGGRASADVTVRWPDGRTTEHRGLIPGLTHVLH